MASGLYRARIRQAPRTSATGDIPVAPRAASNGMEARRMRARQNESVGDQTPERVGIARKLVAEVLECVT